MSVLSQLLPIKKGELFWFFPIFGLTGLRGAVSTLPKDDDSVNKNEKDLRKKEFI